MALVLQPDIHSVSREELEAHIEEVRARRMVAAIEYMEGKNAKLTHEAEKIQRRIKGQYDMLGKEIMRLDSLLEKVEARMVVIESMKQEIGVISDMMLVTDTEESDDE